jgi:phospholipase/carboxylesterase
MLMLIKPPAVSLEALPDVREEPTRTSVPTSRALWLDEHIPVVHADAFMPPPGGREFAHIHTDGSLHLMVSDEVAQEMNAKAWGEPHPLDPRSQLVYAPRDEEEIEIIKRTMLESYRIGTKVSSQ